MTNNSQGDDLITNEQFQFTFDLIDQIAKDSKSVKQFRKKLKKIRKKRKPQR